MLSSVSGAPNPSTVGETVTLSATYDSASGCAVSFVDQTNGNATLCTTNSGTNPVTCTTSFATPGTRTVVGTNTNPGACFGTPRSYSQTVNSVAATVPTVGEWTLWGLAGAMLIGGAAVLARRTRRFS